MKEEKILNIIPEFKICLAEPSYLKDSIEILSEMINEARIKITKTQLEIVEIDPASVCMVSFKLLSSACVEWDVKKEFIFAINLSNLNQILTTVKEHDMLELGRKEDDKLLITLVGKSRREYELPVIDIDEKEQKIPELTFKAKVTMPSELFLEHVEGADIVAESMTFGVSKKEFILSADGDYSKFKAVNKSSEEIEIVSEEDVACRYSIEYLKKITECNKIVDTAEIEFKKEYPLQVTYKLLDKLTFTWVLAPRIENEEK